MSTRVKTWLAPREPLPSRQIFERLRLRIGSAEAEGIVKAGNARRLEFGRLGFGQPVRDIIFVERDLERREHIDDKR